MSSESADRKRHDPPQPVAEPPVRIRAARPEDTPAIASLLAEAFPTLYRAVFGLRNAKDAAAVLAGFYTDGALPLKTMRVAERDERIVGIAALQADGRMIHAGPRTIWRRLVRELGFARALRAFFGGTMSYLVLLRRIPRAPDLAYLEALAVAEGDRGRGIGTLLLEDSIRWSGEQQRRRLALHVLNSNTGALRLYKRMGFRPWHGHPAAESPPKGSLWGSLLMVRSVA